VTNWFRREEKNPNYTLPQYSQHRGHWRPYSKGMYVLHGPDAAKLLYDTSFEGWGGEDVDYFLRVNSVRRIVRRQEPGLHHMWHHKLCRKGEEIHSDINLRNCKASKSKNDGSELGRELLKRERIRQDILEGKTTVTTTTTTRTTTRKPTAKRAGSGKTQPRRAAQGVKGQPQRKATATRKASSSTNLRKRQQ